MHQRKAKIYILGFILSFTFYVKYFFCIRHLFSLFSQNLGIGLICNLPKMAVLSKIQKMTIN